jgi:hypothetical protein
MWKSWVSKIRGKLSSQKEQKIQRPEKKKKIPDIREENIFVEIQEERESKRYNCQTVGDSFFLW